MEKIDKRTKNLLETVEHLQQKLRYYYQERQMKADMRSDLDSKISSLDSKIRSYEEQIDSLRIEINDRKKETDLPVPEMPGGEGSSVVAAEEEEEGYNEDRALFIRAFETQSSDDEGLLTPHAERMEEAAYVSSSEEAESEEEEDLGPVTKEDIEVFAIANSVLRYLRPIYKPMKKFAEHCDVGKRFFEALVTAMASLSRPLLDEDDYYHCGFSEELREQLNELWNAILDSTKESASLPTVIKLFADGEIDLERYPLVGEHAVLQMIQTYNMQAICGGPFTRPYTGYPFRMEVYYDLVPTVRKAPNFFQISVNDYKHYYSEILGTRDSSSLEKLIVDAADKIVNKALCEVEANMLSEFWFKWEIRSSKEDLLSLIKEILWLMVDSRRSSLISGAEDSAMPYVYLLNAWGFRSTEDVDYLINLAECCRRAENARFISTKHFVWAFQESGFVLPHWMKLTGGSSEVIRARPPYHIYGTSIMLAKYLGSLRVEVEHLAYATMFGQRVEPRLEQLEEMAEHYNQLGCKRFERAERTRPTYSLSEPS